jgi:hypothetical protein
MFHSVKLSIGLLLVFITGGCAEKRTAADSGDDMYVVSDGMLAVDTASAEESGISIFDRDGKKMSSVVPLRHGFTISVADGESAEVTNTPDALLVLDSNSDSLINSKDPVWKNMHLAVDYNGDGLIGKGEYALIGECGVDALKLDVQAGQAWSLHSDGETKVMKLPGSS